MSALRILLFAVLKIKSLNDREYRRSKSASWFWHPIISFLTIIIYSLIFILRKKLFWILILLSLGTFGFFLNIFYSSFLIWSEGVYKPWLFLNGFVLFRDVIWNRAGFDLYLLAGFYKLFGIHPLNFQIFIFISQATIGIVMILLLYKKSFSLAVTSYILYISFAFLVYGTISQPAEILIGLFVFLTFYFYWEFIDKKSVKFLFFAGIATGFSLITKQTSIFVFLAMLSLLLIYSKQKLLINTKAYLLGTAVPIAGYVGYFMLNNALYDLYFNTIYVILFPYRENAPLTGFPEGIRLIGLHLAILIPFALIKINNVEKSIKTAIILFVLSLFGTLLPTFWSYRLISALPMFSIMTSFFLLQGYSVIRKHKDYLGTTIVVVGFIVFLIQFKSYYLQSIRYIIDHGGFFEQKYRLEAYRDDEKKVTAWLKNNTGKNERVFNTATNLVLFFSNRFPQNKYDTSMSFGFYPLEQYWGTLTGNPARVVVYDINLPKDWRILKNWKYTNFLKKNYSLKETFGPYEIYVLSKKEKS